MKEMKEFWSLNEGTFYCLYDEVRTDAFKKAIFNTVKSGDVVVELGAGSGVLSLFAADAGAKKVYAVELDKMNASTLRETVKLNGYSDVIEVIEDDATTVEIPEQADVIICEMIATGLIEELQIPAMNHVLNYLKPTGKVLLQRYDITAALVNEKNTFYGKKFHVVRYEFPDLHDLESKLMTETKVIEKIDFTKPTNETFLDKNFIFTILEDGTINGLRIGGNTLFSDNTTFDYSISYSFPAILPVAETEVIKGEQFEVHISYSMCEGPHKLNYSVVKV